LIFAQKRSPDTRMILIALQRNWPISKRDMALNRDLYLWRCGLRLGDGLNYMVCKDFYRHGVRVYAV
jgi:hypothetical protein